jgi:hypothetical protein
MLKLDGMVNPFKKSTAIAEATQLFPAWERVIKVGLYKKLTDQIVSQGQPETVAKVIAAQGVNYITAEDPQAGVENAIEGDQSTLPVLVAHKAEIIPAVQQLLQADPTCRELVVNYLRIKGITLAAALGKDWDASPAKARINGILAVYGPEFTDDPNAAHFSDLVTHFGQVYF